MAEKKKTNYCRWVAEFPFLESLKSDFLDMALARPRERKAVEKCKENLTTLISKSLPIPDLLQKATTEMFDATMELQKLH